MNMSTRTEMLAAATLNDPRWPAVAARDPSADGRFVYAVKTTGVYCRPSCAARAARPENVVFLDSVEAARRAGYRPCKRCKPDAPPLAQQHAALVAQLCRHIESAEQPPTLEQLAQQAGMSPYHLHRVFKAVTGLTPKAYAAAHRAGRVRRELDRAGSVTQAIYEAGYNSSGRFYEESTQLLGMTPSAYRAGGADTEIRFAIGQCSLGSILVARSERGVCAIALGDDPNDARTRAATAFSARRADRRRRRVRAARRPGRRPRRGAACRARPAARRARHRVPAACVAGVARDPAGPHRELRRDREPHRRAEGSARGRAGLRREPARRRDPVPPCRAPRRRAVGLSLGGRAQACAARA